MTKIKFIAVPIRIGKAAALNQWLDGFCEIHDIDRDKVNVVMAGKSAVLRITIASLEHIKLLSDGLKDVVEKAPTSTPQNTQPTS
jgi:hypothetical protein